ncbi:kinesin-like protein KIN-12F [Canna indica]|uniref:Kinesin-like protein KIN-12F n=1 Tax=Canna indica TaxID=4628 RepID=A0AAQ3QD30_9LILI|nr:kinesin-like protein KIN-12F [Canna indica]
MMKLSSRMLRDLRIFRRNLDAGKAPTSESGNENIPVDPSHSSILQPESDPLRAPLLIIQESVQNPKPGLDQGAVLRRNPETTPTKGHAKGSDSPYLPVCTPDKMVARHRFGWAPKGELGMNGLENGDDLSCHATSTQLPPLSRGGGFGPGGGYGSNTPRKCRMSGRASSVHSDCSSTQSTPTKSVTKPANSGFSNSRPPASVGGVRTMSFGISSKATPILSAMPTIVNSAEVSYFELKEDPSFWMDHNVQVVIRVRPLNNTEKNLQGFSRCLRQESAHNITWIGQPETRFTFDYVACETINQEMLFRVSGLPMVENCMSGYNSCVFAYGQTGSGKTYTMLGEFGELEKRPSPNRGMTPRIFEFLFARIKAEEESRRDEKLKYSCKCSFLEIYNEQITDLLDPTSSNLLLREDNRKGVYVENLTEYVVENVNDILKLLVQGSANRKVAATNMNHESSRSHSVFTCVIESRWEKDATMHIRFARLNLVDLAGSERQKTSGAEGERLKEAANINKSLSTLGHVIMLLADMAHGKQRHVPYRDSRLTFLLQDSLGGNSKTMIIANVSPSMCSANETLSTLKFAQRARLIQNNAVVNEDASGDVLALRHQIRLLKEELSVLKRQNVSRSLSFRTTIFEDSKCEASDDSAVDKLREVAKANFDELQNDECLNSIRVSMKQLKSLEAILAGALRREKMADARIKQLEAEIEQLNRLVRQREEDTQSTKMMLKFREDKIRRMENLLDGQVPIDSYLLEEKHWLSEEIQLLRARFDRNPEVTRFALENIRLLDQLRKFQDFYEEGERELLLAEISDLRNKLSQVFDGKSELDQHLKSDMETQEAGNPLFACSSRDNESLLVELNKTHQELASCRSQLQSCLEINEKLTSREISNLHAELNNYMAADHVQHFKPEHPNTELLELSQTDSLVCEKRTECSHDYMVNHTEEILNLELELDILKAILVEEKSTRVEVEEKANCINNELKSANGRILYMSKQYEDIKNELKGSRSIIEALESEQILLINDLEGVREKCKQQDQLLKKQEHEISLLRNQTFLHSSEVEKMSFAQEELKNIPHLSHQNEDSPLQIKLRKMQASLEKARDLNMRYHSDQVSQTSHDEEMDEVRRQVEIETAEVIVCLQDELVALQKQVEDSKKNESVAEQKLIASEAELNDIQIRLCQVTQENEKLGELVEEKDRDLRSLTEHWERLAYEIADILADGNTTLDEATHQVVSISNSFPQSSWIGEQVAKILRSISERDVLIEELQKSLEEAHHIRCDMEWKLRSLRGATLAITEAQQRESSDKEREIVQLTYEITEKASTIKELENRIEANEEQIKKAELCATVAFMTVNRLSEMNEAHIQEIAYLKLLLDESKEVAFKDTLLHHISLHADAEKEIQALNIQLKQTQDKIVELQKISENQERARELELVKKEENDAVLSVIIEDIPKATRTINEFKDRMAALQSCLSLSEQVNDYAEVHSFGKSESEDYIMEERTRAENIHNFMELGRQTAPSLFDVSPDNLLSCRYSSTSDKTPGYFNERQLMILHMKKELDTALTSLQDVHLQMVQLRKENNQLKKSEKQSHTSIKKLAGDILQLESEISEQENKFVAALLKLENKLQAAEKNTIESTAMWRTTKEALEIEVSDAKAIAAQKTIEAAHLLAKIEEAQGTMQEADIMVNMLLQANETAKHDIEKLKNIEITLCYERNCLIDEVQHLQVSLDMKEKEYKYLENSFESKLTEAKDLVLELEVSYMSLQSAFAEKFESLRNDFDWIKSHIQEYKDSIRSCLEVTWSEIIRKDCALSVLHLCHMGILIERITGLNMENGFLQHGLCGSNSVISDLSERNAKAKKELEMCSILKGKLLVDINNSFNRIARKEDETTEFRGRLNSFENKILQLQLQEEFMLARSNCMGTELAVLVKELDDKNRNMLTVLLGQEMLLKDIEVLSRELEDKTRLLNEMQTVNIMFANSLSGELAPLLDGTEFQLKKNVPIVSNTVSCKEYAHLLKMMNYGIELIITDSFAKEVELLVVFSGLEQNILKYGKMASCVTELERQIDTFSSVIENIKLEVILSKIDGDLQCEEMQSLEKENERMRKELLKLHEDYWRVTKELEDKVCFLEKDLNRKKAELQEKVHHHTLVSKELDRKHLLKNKLLSFMAEKSETIQMLGCSIPHGTQLAQSVDLTVRELKDKIDDLFLLLLEWKHQEENQYKQMASKFMDEIDLLEHFIKNLISETCSLQSELMHKDEVSKGILFDLRLLQESASIAKDQEVALKEMAATLDSLEDELESRSHELDDAVEYGKMLEAELTEKNHKISNLEFDVAEKLQMINLIAAENSELKSDLKEISSMKSTIEEELKGKAIVVERLEEEILDISTLIGERNNLFEDLQSGIAKLKQEKDNLDTEVHALKEKLDMAQALADENEAIATEAFQTAEERKSYLVEKEEEVKLLERSVEELECTVHALENKVNFLSCFFKISICFTIELIYQLFKKVDIVKAEAEKQRLHREEIEMELHSVRDQVVQQNVQVLQKEIAKRDAEILQCKAHISELNIHAEAQAREYKLKFKELEAMAQKVNADPASSNAASLTSTKSEKSASKPRGSSSPFKCIGLGLVQQMNSEKDEELTEARRKIEELESLVASRQKEIFMLNTRLAQAESMTHDVIRDLLGVKLDMTSLLDQPEMSKIKGTTQSCDDGCEQKEQELTMLKKELKEFIDERQSWMHEIKQRHKEMVDARIMAEKLQQREQFLSTENEMLKVENTKYKKININLEDELKKLSNQKNLQHRIHHHAKIKEENTFLKIENEDLSVRLKRSEEILSRVKEELAHYRESVGNGPYIDFDKEEQLRKKLEESEEESIQLAQKLLSLCTCIFRVAGLTEPGNNISTFAAEEALNQLKDRINLLENELEGLKLKCKLLHEDIRISAIRQQLSPQHMRTNEEYLSPSPSQSLCSSS